MISYIKAAEMQPFLYAACPVRPAALATLASLTADAIQTAHASLTADAVQTAHASLTADAVQTAHASLTAHAVKIRYGKIWPSMIN